MEIEIEVMDKNKKSVEEELKDLSPFLLQLKQETKSPSVPEGYFDHLPDSVLQALNNAKAPNEGKSATIRPLWIRYAAAASIAIVFGVAFILLRDANFRPQSEMAIDLSSQEVESYIQENLEDFELELLVEYATETSSSSFNDLLEQEFENGELDQYMDELIDDVDLETIEELL